VTVGDDKVEKKVMVKVWVVSLRSGRKTHRVMAECPHCHFDMSAGRLFQHRCN
jgi:hypothetical protein